MKTRIISSILSAVILSSCGSKDKETQPQYKAITETVFASGTLEPEAKYNLTAQSDGYVVSLNFKENDVVIRMRAFSVKPPRPSFRRIDHQ